MDTEVLFAHFPRATPLRYQTLVQIFGSLDTAWTCTREELCAHVPWKPEFIDEFIQWRSTVDEQKILAQLNRAGITCISQQDPQYPEQLKQIYDPPVCLFVRGTLATNKLFISVVGTRRATSYGRQVTKDIVLSLADNDVGIVSGLAFGIDSAAHRATLDANGYTVAVLPGGIDDISIQPASHRDLAQKILANGGTLVSERPPGTTATKHSFPQRNRIIAGMSRATVVIECKEKSGALITAQCALDAGRDVFAVPQNITHPTARGTNTLIANGATPIVDTQTIVDALNLDRRQKKIVDLSMLSTDERTVYNALALAPQYIDELTHTTALPHHIIVGIVSGLELRGYIEHIGSTQYIQT